MHAVINHLHLTKAVDELRDAMDRELIPLLRAQPGLRGFYFVREADDRGAAIILWDSGEAVQQGAAVIGPGGFAQNIAPHLASEQARTTGDGHRVRGTLGAAARQQQRPGCPPPGRFDAMVETGEN